ncbi:MAG: hypothetical protein AAF351_02700 [Pseudomonadota bacterium]
MSNERDISNDSALTTAYRELATETTPASLDDAVLREAAGASKTSSYASIIGWTRPIAWAATIGLTLFITLQLADTPTPLLDTPAEEMTQSTQAEERTEPDHLNDAEHRANPPAAASREADSEAAVRQRASIPAPAATDASNQKAARSVADEFIPPDTQLLERADAMAELQAGSERALEPQTKIAIEAASDFDSTADAAMSAEVAEAESGADEIVVTGAKIANPADEVQAAVASSSRVSKAPASVPNCSAEQRNSAEDWMNCIEELESAGLHRAAQAERLLLMEAFPDFEVDESR